MSAEKHGSSLQGSDSLDAKPPVDELSYAVEGEEETLQRGLKARQISMIAVCQHVYSISILIQLNFF